MRELIVTDEHIALLQRVNVDKWPDCHHRPYGNRDYIEDIAEILGWELIEDRHGEFVMTAEQGNRAEKLHDEMQTVLQILVQHPFTFQPGRYVTEDPYSNKWKRVMP